MICLCSPQLVATLYSYMKGYRWIEWEENETRHTQRNFAGKRSEQPGVTQADVARELGLSAQQIANWKRQFTRLSDKQFNSAEGVDYSKKESEELRRLRRENKRLQEETDFLKKVSAYFAKSQE